MRKLKIEFTSNHGDIEGLSERTVCFLDYLKQLDSEVYSNVIENRDIINNGACHITSIFTWSETTQGREYWSEINSKYARILNQIESSIEEGTMYGSR